ncbi:hypothetical protein Tco_1221550 [Tanacetum coccineum]
MQLPPKKENQDRLCDYHNEKGHYSNDYYQLRRQLESAVESRKLNHLIKDVRQTRRAGPKGKEGGNDKVINMIRSWIGKNNRKLMGKEEGWMSVLVTFPLISSKDILDEPIIVEADIEGEVIKPEGKIELEVTFRDEGLYRRMTMKFTVIRAPSPSNIILGRTGLKALRESEGPWRHKSLVKEHNSLGNVSPIHLNFDEDRDTTETRTIVTGKKVGDTDLKRPFKETVKTSLTRRIIEFAGPEFKMPTYIKFYDGTTDLEDHLSRFASAANSGEWPMPVWCQIQQTLDGNAKVIHHQILDERACFKDPTEITKIMRKANETLVAFKERWMVETCFILDVSEIMKIYSFMDAHKCPELAKRYSDKVPDVRVAKTSQEVLQSPRQCT